MGCSKKKNHEIHGKIAKMTIIGTKREGKKSVNSQEFHELGFENIELLNSQNNQEKKMKELTHY